jgi:hypothetical protein
METDPISPAPIEAHLSRRMWQVLEPYHAMIYFAPEAREAFTGIGLKGYWMGYFASRAAPLGPVPAEVVVATFYNFHPRMVARAIPDAWRFADPARILSTRYAAADAALNRLLDDTATSDDLAEAAALARRAAEACPLIGRPLFAAYAALPWPDRPHLILWHAATLLREFRGDGHVHALLTGNIDGCEAHITLSGTGSVPREALQPHRGWSDDEWMAAEQRLRQRGWLDATGALTPAGRAGRDAVEVRTDELALPPWRAIGDADCARLYQLAWPLSNRIVTGGGVPMPNPTGVSWQ